MAPVCVCVCVCVCVRERERERERERQTDRQTERRRLEKNPEICFSQTQQNVYERRKVVSILPTKAQMGE